jgi:hypothetical protein
MTKDRVGTVISALLVVATGGTAAGQVATEKKMPIATRKAFATKPYVLAPYAGAPDASLTVEKSPEGYQFGHVDSKRAGYTASGSPYFVVDVTIPADFTVSTYDKRIRLYAQLTAWSTLTDSQGACANASTAWAVFKRAKTGGGEYSTVVAESKQGTWVPSAEPGVHDYCDSGTSMVIAIPTPEGAAGKPTAYRIMALPKFKGTAQAATVGWHWNY